MIRPAAPDRRCLPGDTIQIFIGHLPTANPLKVGHRLGRIRLFVDTFTVSCYQTAAPQACNRFAICEGCRAWLAKTIARSLVLTGQSVMTTTSESFDLIVIGSGPAGEKGAARAAYFGKRVALVERQPVLGGAAANTGTLPSKTLRETALYLSGFRQRQLFGLDVRGLKERVHVSDFLAHERVVKDTERARIFENLRKHHITIFSGSAAFVDPQTVAVRPERCPETRIRADKILIATGSYPFRPKELPFYDPRICDSDTILMLHEIPRRMLVVGGGVIGCEYACMFAALGVQVVLVEKRGGILNFMDPDIVATLQGRMEKMGILFYFNDAVANVDCLETMKVHLASGAALQSDIVLISSGRCGNIASLELDNVGVAYSDRGIIKVNEWYQTTQPNIYAAGDVVGSPALASTSMEQGRAAVVHACQLQNQVGMEAIMPTGIYTIPECSMVGESEETLRKKKIPFVVGTALYEKNARGQIVGDNFGFLKLLFRAEDMQLLGVHVVGEQAAEIIHIGLTALMLKANLHLFLETCYNYPTLSEMYKYAAYEALGRKSRGEVEGGEAKPG
jgi:NAD(P) transhydrogenase